MMDRGLLRDQATSSVLGDAGMLAYNLDEFTVTRRTLSDSVDLESQLVFKRIMMSTYPYWPHLGTALVDQLTRKVVQEYIPHGKSRKLVLMILTSQLLSPVDSYRLGSRWSSRACRSECRTQSKVIINSSQIAS